MLNDLIAVSAADLSVEGIARELAERIGLDYVADDLSAEQWLALLRVTAQGLQLQQTGRKAPGPVWADFVSGAVAHRRKFGGGKGQMIAKAVGVKGSVRPTVADVTAGLGKDSFVLATLGCEVTLVERSPIIHALLQDGLQRASADAEVADIADRMSLLHSDSISWLNQLTESGERPQVVYVDPMFPHRDKSSQVKKEMKLFQPIVGDDSDASALLEAALAAAQNRVVVKRPRKAPCIDGPKPGLVFEGKSCRYDVYPLKKME